MKRIAIIVIALLVLLGGYFGYKAYRANAERELAAQREASARAKTERIKAEAAQRAAAEAEARRLAELKAQQEAEARLAAEKAQANLAPVPDGLTDEQVLMCPDIMSTGFAGAEAANIKIGDIVAVFAQGPIGLCATAGARLRGASLIIAVDGVDERLAISRRLGADVTLNFRKVDVVDEILKLTGGRGVDASIEALGLQSTFEQALRVLKPGGTLSSLGVYSGDLTIPLGAFHAGLGDNRIVTSLCPGGKERMRRLLNVVASGRVDLGALVTHEYTLDKIVDAYDLFSHQRDGVLKVAIKPF